MSGQPQDHPVPPPVVAGSGHTLVWDPPAALTAVRRWTCTVCEDAVLDNRDHIYGSASERTCAEGQVHLAELRELLDRTRR